MKNIFSFIQDMNKMFIKKSLENNINLLRLADAAFQNLSKSTNYLKIIS